MVKCLKCSGPTEVRPLFGSAMYDHCFKCDAMDAPVTVSAHRMDGYSEEVKPVYIWYVWGCEGAYDWGLGCDYSGCSPSMSAAIRSARNEGAGHVYGVTFAQTSVANYLNQDDMEVVMGQIVWAADYDD